MDDGGIEFWQTWQQWQEAEETEGLTVPKMANSMVLHVVGATCDLSGMVSKPRFGKFSNDTVATMPSSRRAAKPENFTKAGFFFGACRTPHVRTEPEWAARKKTPATLHPRVEPTELRAGISEFVSSSGETSGTKKANARLMAQLVSSGTMWRYGQGYHPLGNVIA